MRQYINYKPILNRAFKCSSHLKPKIAASKSKEPIHLYINVSPCLGFFSFLIIPRFPMKSLNGMCQHP